jgi:hypothetical protein
MPTMMKTRRRQVGSNNNRNALSSNNQINLFIHKGRRSNNKFLRHITSLQTLTSNQAWECLAQDIRSL